MSVPSNENSAQNAQQIEAREQDKTLPRQEKAQALMELARARKAFFTVLVVHLEQYDDPFAQVAAVELRADRNWQALELWYAQRRARRFFRRRMRVHMRMIEGQANG